MSLIKLNIILFVRLVNLLVSENECKEFSKIRKKIKEQEKAGIQEPIRLHPQHTQEHAILIFVYQTWIHEPYRIYHFNYEF